VSTSATPHAAATPRILVAGGDSDPNLSALIRSLAARGIAHDALLVGANTHPRVSWDLQTDLLHIDGVVQRPRALFARYDVFTGLAGQRPGAGFRAAAWFTTITAWAHAHPDVRLLNRASELRTPNKPYVLQLARACGLPVPATLITNDAELLEQASAARPLIVKPVNGGDYTHELPEVLARAPRRGPGLAAPAIVQERLIPPEVRIYGIAGRFFAFQVIADALDYRTVARCQLLPMDLSALPRELLDGLAALMDQLRMDFGAADFKTCATTGQLRFLELNSGPMFAAFDAVCSQALTRALGDFLIGEPEGSLRCGTATCFL
jgi:hypothetical protein